MPSFGEKLKQEREKRKISLEQISVSTKIGTRMLQALEEEKFSQLPGGIFNKGFVRAYSRFVGLDEEQTVAEYLEASGDAPPVRTDPGGYEAAGHEDRARENEQTVRRLEAISDSHARQLPWGLFAAFLLVVALALSLWSYRQRERARQSVRPTPTTATAPLPSSANGPSRAVVRENDSAGSPTSSSPAAEAAPSAAPKTPQNLNAAARATTPGEFAVVIQVRQESWVSIAADGKTISSELLPAGSERTARGRKEIVVKTGNAGALEFRFNGKRLDSVGKYGEVKTVTFGPGGMLPSTPAPPSTP